MLSLAKLSFSYFLSLTFFPSGFLRLSTTFFLSSSGYKFVISTRTSTLGDHSWEYSSRTSSGRDSKWVIVLLLNFFFDFLPFLSKFLCHLESSGWSRCKIYSFSFLLIWDSIKLQSSTPTFPFYLSAYLMFEIILVWLLSLQHFHATHLFWMRLFVDFCSNLLHVSIPPLSFEFQLCLIYLNSRQKCEYLQALGACTNRTQHDHLQGGFTFFHLFCECHKFIQSYLVPQAFEQSVVADGGNTVITV